MISILSKVLLNGQTLLLFCALLGIAWAYFLLTHKRGNLSANKFLALLIFVFAALILRHTASLELDRDFSLFLYMLSQGFIYLVGPSIYFHIEHLTGNKTSSINILKHFMPAIFTSVFMMVLFFFRVAIMDINNILFLKIFSISFISIQILHLLVYIFYARKLVVAYEQRLKRYYSSLSKINLRWIKQLMVITSSFAVLILGMHILIITGEYYEINNDADFLFLTVIAIIILSIVIKSWKQPEIVSGVYEEDHKYKTSPLSSPESDKLKEKLDQLISKEKVYLTPELNLNQLATDLDVQPYIISQLINQEYNQNFFNFINGFRIEFALGKIQNGDLKHTTLVGIAYDSGFNSKSTFNRAFRKKMGCTPKEYGRSLKAQN